MHRQKAKTRGRSDEARDLVVMQPNRIALRFSTALRLEMIFVVPCEEKKLFRFVIQLT